MKQSGAKHVIDNAFFWRKVLIAWFDLKSFEMHLIFYSINVQSYYSNMA